MGFEIGVILILVALVTAGFVYLPRLEPEPAVRFWAWGWAALVVQLGLDALQIGGQQAAYNFFSFTAGLAGPVLFLAGAYAYAGRAMPGWLIPAGMAAAVLRGALAAAGLIQPMILASLVTEVPLLTAGAIVLNARSTGSVSDRLLVFAYAGMAVLEGAAAAQWAFGTQGPWLGVVAAAVLLAAAFAQLMAVLSRVRERERDTLDLLREVARSSATYDDPAALGRSVLRRLRDGLGLDAGGLWLADPEARVLESVEIFGLPEELRGGYERIPFDRSDGRAVLALREPLVSDALSSEARFQPAAGRGSGFQGGALVPLRNGEESLGFLFAGLRPPRRFPEEQRRVLTAVGDELTLALRHVAAIRDIATQAEVHEAERRTLRAVLDTAPLGILLEDREGRVAMLSRGAQREGARASWIGLTISELAQRFDEALGDTDVERLRVVRETSRPQEAVELHFEMPDGERILELFSGPVLTPEQEMLGRVWIARNVTEERRLEEALRQSQKLETVGRLTGGIAHDFNNQLTTILGNVRLALERPLEDEDLRDSLVDLERAADHCAKLVRSLLAFSRRSPLTRVSLDVEKTLDDLRELLRPLLPSSIRLQTACEGRPAAVSADPVQLKQVLLNLAVNARDAIDEGGEIRIAVRPRELRPDEVNGLPPGHYVEFEVRDDGEGLAPHAREHLFEPFFTTKPLGEGTGLGLAIVYGVVKAHGGAVEVESEAGRGSSFRVILPIAGGPADDHEPAAADAPARGSETVLVAEDEDLLRRLACRTLEGAGYRVLDARDGDEAIERFREHAREIDLAFVDVTMPGRTGYSVLSAIRSIAPGIPVLLTSGHPDPDLAADAGRETAFLEKPYTPDALGRQIRAMLDAASD